MQQFKEDIEAKYFIHNEQESQAAYLLMAEKILSSDSLDFPTPALNRMLTPMLGGQITTFVARPGHGKTSTLIALAKHTARKFQFQNRENGKKRRKVVIYISWEERLESIEGKLQGGGQYTAEDLARKRVTIEQVRRQAVASNRVMLPIIIIARSSIRYRNERKPDLSVAMTKRVIERMFYDLDIEPGLLIGDYIQRIPENKGLNRTGEVTQAVKALSTLCIDLDVPLATAAQANRDVDIQSLPMPTMSSAQHASIIEQESHRQVGNFTPTMAKDKNGLPFDDKIEINGIDYKVDDNLTIFGGIKQRDAPMNPKILPVHFNKGTFEMFDIEVDPVTKKPLPVGANNGQS